MLCFLAHRNGWLPLYPSVAVMPAETAAVYLYALSVAQKEDEEEQRWRNPDGQLMAAMATADLLRELSGA